MQGIVDITWPLYVLYDYATILCTCKVSMISALYGMSLPRFGSRIAELGSESKSAQDVSVVGTVKDAIEP